MTFHDVVVNVQCPTMYIVIHAPSVGWRVPPRPSDTLLCPGCWLLRMVWLVLGGKTCVKNHLGFLPPGWVDEVLGCQRLALLPLGKMIQLHLVYLVEMLQMLKLHF